MRERCLQFRRQSICFAATTSVFEKCRFSRAATMIIIVVLAIMLQCVASAADGHVKPWPCQTMATSHHGHVKRKLSVWQQQATRHGSSSGQLPPRNERCRTESGVYGWRCARSMTIEHLKNSNIYNASFMCRLAPGRAPIATNGRLARVRSLIFYNLIVSCKELLQLAQPHIVSSSHSLMASSPHDLIASSSHLTINEPLVCLCFRRRRYVLCES